MRWNGKLHIASGAYLYYNKKPLECGNMVAGSNNGMYNSMA